MRVLAIETSGEICGLAVADERGLAGAVEFRHRMSLSRLLLPAIDQLLALLEMSPADLEGIAVSLGPGSFTGLRVGVTTAKTMAWALSLPVVGVATLEAVAAGARLPPGSHVCAAIPTGAAGDVPFYAAVYRVEPEGPAAIVEPAPRTGADVLAISERYDAPILLGGASPEAAAAELGARLLPDRGGIRLPNAATVARLGQRLLGAGTRADAETLAPLYIRPSTAEARRQACHPS